MYQSALFESVRYEGITLQNPCVNGALISLMPNCHILLRSVLFQREHRSRSSRMTYTFWLFFYIVELDIDSVLLILGITVPLEWHESSCTVTLQ